MSCLETRNTRQDKRMKNLEQRLSCLGTILNTHWKWDTALSCLARQDSVLVLRANYALSVVRTGDKKVGLVLSWSCVHSFSCCRGRQDKTSQDKPRQDKVIRTTFLLWQKRHFPLFKFADKLENHDKTRFLSYLVFMFMLLPLSRTQGSNRFYSLMRVDESPGIEQMFFLLLCATCEDVTLSSMDCLCRR